MAVHFQDPEGTGFLVQSIYILRDNGAEQALLFQFGQSEMSGIGLSLRCGESQGA